MKEFAIPLLVSAAAFSELCIYHVLDYWQPSLRLFSSLFVSSDDGRLNAVTSLDYVILVPR